ncbi:Sua5/YciO/YrdC family protein [Oceanicola granulosus HTCC2516]|uniref:Threonylcarbamoyl-AMP synthase n=1 Tax=Oceanicola granulosus (strain ATCC BAA-861 / DSM 15982 / KCTC 12143 / HTCC2516) TaxID=314256 RepID=Q2CCF0_OCEGH|nr:L-threonylcarbamoyladenylate synthase [Oceanicola granulosus]EAR50368.1 Sua5/YciO/YrdC family protein [Oceanicola granulosus HTCC2516]
MTLRLALDDAGLAEAARLLRTEGGIVAFPTETVYGLGARACDDRAVARVFEAKGRPAFNPLIVHCPDLATVETLCTLPPGAGRLAATFWPGPLTLVLPLRPDAPVSPLVTDGRDTLAVRLPDHPAARALLARTGPLAGPSANPSGRISPTSADHVLAGLDGRIDAVLDAGPCPVGLESTIVALLPEPTLLRAGGLPTEALEACLGAPLAAHGGGEITAPGQLASHYAPRGTLRLDADAPAPGETYLGFGPASPGALNLSPSGDLVEAAARLFAALHALDAAGARRIAVAPIPAHGLGRAINDRLRRAAAPRDEPSSG